MKRKISGKRTLAKKIMATVLIGTTIISTNGTGIYAATRLNKREDEIYEQINSKTSISAVALRTGETTYTASELENEIAKSTTEAQKYIGLTVKNYSAGGLTYQLFDVKDGKIYLISKEKGQDWNTTDYSGETDLGDKTKWTKYVDTEQGAEYATGSPTLIQFIESWNKTHDNKIYYSSIDVGTTRGGVYSIGKSENPTSLDYASSDYAWDTTGYNGVYYNDFDYILDSRQFFNESGTQYVDFVVSNKMVTKGEGIFATRPIVCLNENVTLSFDEGQNEISIVDSKKQDTSSENDENSEKAITTIESKDKTKTIKIYNSKIEVTENGATISVDIDSKMKDPNIETSEYDQNVKDILSKIYGTEVEYKSDSDSNKEIDNLTWRIFYIDFANKYGDGIGAVYLKADWNENNVKLYENRNFIPTDSTVLSKMNPQWWDKRGNLQNQWYIKEHIAAYLCDTNSFKQYKTSKAKYAIGGPSVEMYCDSYNSVNHPTDETTDFKTSYKIIAQLQTSGDSDEAGYGYLVDGKLQANLGWITGNNVLDYINYSSMYCGKDKNNIDVDYRWWLASPRIDSSNDDDHNAVCIVDSNGAKPLGGAIRDDFNEIDLCPLVAIGGTTLTVSEIVAKPGTAVAKIYINGTTPISGAKVILVDGNGNAILDGNGNQIILTTGVDGTVDFSSAVNLVPGSYGYRITEVPEGYSVDTTKIYGFTVDSTGKVIYTDGGNGIVNVTYVVAKPGSAVVRVYINGTTTPISGAKVILVDGNGNAILDENGNQIILTTGADGTVDFSSVVNLVPGSYGYRIIGVPAGYSIDTTKVYGFTVDSTGRVIYTGGGNGTINVSYIVAKPGSAVVRTYISGTTTPIAGARIILVDGNGNAILDENGNQIILTTGADGTVDFSSVVNLVPGSYGYRIIGVPAGYSIDTTKVYGFTVDSTGKVIYTGGGNGIVNITKTGSNGTINKVQPKSSTVKITNGGTDTGISGVKVKLYDENNNAVLDTSGKQIEVVSNDKGEVDLSQIGKVKPGKYTFKISDFPAGYQQTDTVIPFKVNDDGTITQESSSEISIHKTEDGKVTENKRK